MSSEIAQIVERTYREHIGLPPAWSSVEEQAFLDRETTRLDLLVATLAAELGEAAISSWTQEQGLAADYPTTVRLLNTARAQAQEVVLEQELYSQIQAEQAPTEEQAPGPATEVDWGNPNRWRTPRRSEPSEAVTELVARVWPTRSDLFVIKAEYLLQARHEDGLELPSSPDSPLTQDLTRLVEDDLVSDGLPLR